MSESPKALRQAAVSAHQDGDLENAAALYARYLAVEPVDASIWSNLGALHRKVGRHQMALRAHERAMSIDPTASGARNNYANILSDLGRYDDSIAVRMAILKDAPDNTDHKAMVGRCYRGKGDYAAAIAWLEQAISEHPDDAEMHMQLAFAQLGAGNYADGFQSYRWRWKAGELSPRTVPFPEWQGEKLLGKTIVVLPEQGFGDAILFSRFLPLLKAEGARVLFLTEKPLLRLFSTVKGADWVGTQLSKSEKVDFWVNAMDIAALHFRRDKAVPAPTNLMVPEESRKRAIDLVAPHKDRFKVGVVWSGSPTYKANAFRSFNHIDLLPLTDIPGVQLFSLYKGPGIADFTADGTSGFIIDAAGTERDFADCAATMEQMNLVVSSDTATVHVAGSLGIPVWAVLHWDAFWVWGHAGSKTDWYPGMRLFRQEKPLHWTDVISEIHSSLLSTIGEV